MANPILRFFGLSPSGPKTIPPFREAGRSGTAIYGGFVRQQEHNPNLSGQQRYVRASEVLTNISIVAAGVRYFLNLIAKPTWKMEPADDSDKAAEIAEFVDSVVNGMETSWSRIVRRSGMFKYHGFNISEWTAKKLDDGRIGLDDIEQRPAHTIWRWGIDPNGGVTGVYQRPPSTGEEIWLPRSKIMYLVDDMMTDSPEGMGWFRAIVEPAARLKRLQDLETIAFERNLAGTPIGRVPYSEIARMIESGEITKQQADEAINVMERFVDLQAKEPNTSLILDSAPYENITDAGSSVSSTMKWGIELLEGNVTGLADLGSQDGAIMRTIYDIARIMGIEGLLTGQQGKGSLALSSNQSENLYLVVNSTLKDMAEATKRDIVWTICNLNNIPMELAPTPKTEDVAFKDIDQISAVLRDMATAGAVLSPDDPAINDMRQLAGISPVPEDIMNRERDMAIEAAKRPPAPVPGKPGQDPNPEKDKAAVEKMIELELAKRYNPDQPRNPKGSEGGGRWKGQTVEITPETLKSFYGERMKDQLGPDASVSVINSGRDGLLVTASGNGIAMQRKFKLNEKTGEWEVEHLVFKMDEAMQGQGRAREMLNNSIEAYDAMGVRKIGVYADMDVGGYAWARIGFRADAPDYLVERAGRRLDVLKGSFTDHEFASMKSFMANLPLDKDTAYNLASMRVGSNHVGKQLMMGLEYPMHVDLGDKASRERLDAYLKG